MRITMFISCILCAVFLCACGAQKVSDKKVSDVSFSVVNEEDIPETLLTAIEEKKMEPFKLSYSDNNDLYLVVGYGRQPTGGYSIIVDELYTTENTIVFATTLNGPGEKDIIQEAETYLYIVVKMEYLDYEVIYK